MSAFDNSPCPTEIKLEHFTKYVRRQKIARLLVQYELLKLISNVKGSIVECGVHHGGGVMAWAKLSSTLEPYNYHRKVIGFDTFEGFPSVDAKDKSIREAVPGMFKESYNIFDELTDCIGEYDENRFINHIGKVDLVKGDAMVTIPKYIEQNKHLIVSLLYLDFDIYEPTAMALKRFLPRIPKGGVIAFDEVNNPHWPGETLAMLEILNLGLSELRCFPFEPNVAYIQL